MKDAENAKTSYHHGDLHSALIAAGLKLLTDCASAEDLSLRELARRVGVSATAVYRHFPHKKSLMGALARQGLIMLANDQRAASESVGGGLAGFGATGAAYVRFAIANPALFRLIFAHPFSADMKLGSPLDHADDAMCMLRDNAAAAAPPGIDPQIYALQAWSLAHGLAMLALDGQVRVTDAMIDTVIDPRYLR